MPCSSARASDVGRRVQRRIEYARLVRRRPDSIAGRGEVVTDPDRFKPRIEPHEYETQALAQMVGQRVQDLRQVFHDQLRDLPAHANAVVGPPVLGVDLGGVGQVSAFDRRPVTRHVI